MTLKRYLFVLLLIFLAVDSNASIEGEMDAMIGSMKNTTAPSVQLSDIGRGVISWGAYQQRNHITDTNLVSFVPPSMEAGCGGINIFNGSISFVSGDEFKQLLRDIASNAEGYAFELALGVMCPKCLQTMETLRQSVQKLNEKFGNSCQLAKGLVNGGVGAMAERMRQDGVSKGVFADLADLVALQTEKDIPGGKTAIKAAEDSGLYRECEGAVNLVWCAMKIKGANAWFENGGTDDNQMLRAIMSITGTVVVGKEKDSKVGPTVSGKASPVTIIRGGKIGLRDLMVGGDLPLLGCSDGFEPRNCREVSSSGTENIQGMREYVHEVFFGDGSTPGVLRKMATNQGALTTAEKQFMANAPGGVGPYIRNLSVISPGAAATFARNAEGYIALGLVSTILDGMLDVVNTAKSGVVNDFMPELDKSMDGVEASIAAEKILLQGEVGSELDLHEFYLRMMEASKKEKYDILGNGTGAPAIPRAAQ